MLVYQKEYVEHDQAFRMVSQGNCSDAIRRPVTRPKISKSKGVSSGKFVLSKHFRKMSSGLSL